MNHTPNRSASPDTEAHNAHQIAASLKAYVDGELSPVHRWWVELHIGQCVACRTEVATLRHLATALKAAKDSVPNGLPQSASVPRAQLRTRILANLPDSAPMQVARIRRSVGAQTNPWSMRLPALATGSLAALLLVVVGAYAHNHGTPGQQPKLTALSPLAPGEAESTSKFPTTSEKVASVSRSGPQQKTTIDPFAPRASRDVQTASGQESKPDSVTGSDYTDPISREADRLISERHQAKSQIAKAISNRPNQTPANQNTSSADAGQPLVLAVADVSVAARQVQELTATTGASVSLYSQNPASSTDPASGTTVLKIKVPVDQLSAFTTRLSHLGTPLVSSSKGTTNNTGTSQPQGPLPKKLDLKNPFYDRLLPRTAPITHNQSNHEQATSNTTAPTIITFYLRLQK